MITRPQIALISDTFLPAQGVNIQYVRSLPGNESGKTTDIYTNTRRITFAKIKTLLSNIFINNKMITSNLYNWQTIRYKLHSNIHIR